MGGNRVVSAFMLSPPNAAGQEAVVGSSQPIDVARSWIPCDATVRYRIEDFIFQVSDRQPKGSTSEGVQFEGILPGAAPGIAYAPVDVVIDIHPEVC